MKQLHLEVITPSKAAFKGEVESVTIPGTLGSFQILYNHAPILSTFEIGIIKIADLDGGIKLFATGGGTVEVLNNNIIVLAESFESPEQIVLERAKSAEQRAKERLSQKNKHDIDIARAESSLKRAINRIKLINKK